MYRLVVITIVMDILESRHYIQDGNVWKVTHYIENGDIDS